MSGAVFCGLYLELFECRQKREGSIKQANGVSDKDALLAHLQDCGENA